MLDGSRGHEIEALRCPSENRRGMFDNDNDNDAVERLFPQDRSIRPADNSGLHSSLNCIPTFVGHINPKPKPEPEL
jgi:hypothetical protein